MATLLYRIGRFSYSHRWLVAGLWVLLAAAGGIGAATLSGQMSNSFTVPGTEAQRAINQLSERFPQAHVGGASARVVFVAPRGQTLVTAPNQAAVEQVVTALKQAPRVASVVDPYRARALSPDGRYAIAQVSYTVQGIQLTPADRTALIRTGDVGRAAGLTVEVGGDALRATPTAGATEVAGVLVAALVLVITFGSLVAAGLPLLTAVAGVGVGLSGIAIASGFIDINANSLILALMLGLAVGIDYALFISSRFRHELREHSDGAEAAGRAVGTAGSAVVFAGLTVIIALAGLSVVGIPVLGSMGLAAAATVAVAVLVAVSFLPALLGIVGRRAVAARLFGRAPADPESDEGPANMGERWSRFVIRFRIPVLLLALAGLGAVSVPAAHLRLGLPDDGMSAPGTTQRKAYDLISKGFSPGFNGPLTVVVSGTGTGSGNTPGSGPGSAPGAAPGAIAGPGGATVAAATRTATAIRALPDVVAVAPPTLSPDGATALLTVIPASGPNDQKTTALVRAIRAEEAALHEETGAQVSVTGQTAINIDVSDRIGRTLLPYLALVVGLAFLLLTLVFRSILVPLKATIGFLLSVAATFGAVVAVFQWGWLRSALGVAETGPIMSLLPVLLIGILFGLAMDYQVFLVTRMREDHVHGAGAQHAITTGFRHGARVVTAAAIIMISVFGGFVLSHEVLIKSIGFALAFGVLVDAFVVRMTIVPAVMSLLDRAAWWLPRWLDRILPRVDVEGERLRRPGGRAATATPDGLEARPADLALRR